MGTGLASVRDDRGLDRVEQAVRSLEDEWRHGNPVLERHWGQHEPTGSVSVLAALVKADLRCRFARGERPAVADYLERFPALRDQKDRVVSLIYEEFCLLEEGGERLDAAQFCARYEPWRDSLESQLGYHRLLSQAAGTAPPKPRFPEPGDYFEEFHLHSKLGEGGAGRVYRASDKSLGGREVALKVSLDRGQEPSILARLNHAHIMPVLSVVFQSETNLRGLCMPYRAGLPLDELIRKIGPDGPPATARALWEAIAPSVVSDSFTSEPRPGWAGFPIRGTYSEAVAWIGAILADALADAHAKEILHRDVKPANVLLTLRDGPQLLDFNLAHDPHSTGQAEAALRGGTLLFMAPEQLEAFLDPARWDQVKASADLYSLGLLLRELLTGETPDAPDPTLPLPRAIGDLLDRRRDAKVGVRDRNPLVPHALEAIVVRCLAPAPADRYPSAKALAVDLQHFLDRRPLRFATNPSTKERLRNWTGRNTRKLALAAVVLVALSVAAYKPLIRMTVPLERRSEMQAAVVAVDRGHSHEAIPSLKSLVQDYPDSPLGWLYLSLALNHEKDPEGASRNFATALQKPKARAVMAAWGLRHPSAGAQFEKLGTDLRISYPGLAREAWLLSLSVQPGRTLARQCLAELDARDKKYEAAHATLSELIQEAEARNSKENLNQLLVWYRSRAHVAINWGDRLLAEEPSPAADRAAELFVRAARDLARGRKLLPLSRPVLMEYDFLTARTEIGLGEISIRRKQIDQAREHCQEAKTIIGRLQPVGSDRDSKTRLAQLRQRLSAIEAKLAAASMNAEKLVGARNSRFGPS